MIWLALAICVWGIFQNLIQILLIYFRWKNHSAASPSKWPMVSILIAVRNEELELPKLLESLDELDYPESKLEILFADDNSTDRTLDLLQEWAGGNGNRRIFHIGTSEEGEFHPNGKANALAFLGKEAKGEHFFFTDGDCVVPTSWVKEGISSFIGNTGILIGITAVKTKGFFSQMQALDWWNTLGIVKVVTDLRLPTTGLGNNMVISRDAYIKSGGFENLPEGLTEDLEISRAIVNSGFTINQQVSDKILVHTKAEYSLRKLLEQRKRWVGGAMTLSLGWKILLGLQFIFFPAIIFLIAMDFKTGISIWLIKVFLQSVFIAFFAKKARQKIGFLYLFVFDFYQLLSYTLTILYYFWPSPVEWKSRRYP
ncbi:cellulose synthase/poly-beta-1,6-N-acetylglucosamine synthase-like glycosyltransferase [Algoriphagus boseongensis]|uniref:Cellulose synthase/poly-beta-1,6-N-acetylglucosamine synthase-like glycosyltransferase n=1 Tax=Algoriphagus boseongensis TaxID=1442587 RepID=A0A4R6T5J2_9BACT|nr:glycosyltransferase [Algoriphagus boseongensis]TDQ15026.1 cellulose synthase/poly-beta-1,6-N-acetylglucosamine synthase-like glycosyltransferase [Algoriphagus boseongensis]